MNKTILFISLILILSNTSSAIENNATVVGCHDLPSTSLNHSGIPTLYIKYYEWDIMFAKYAAFNRSNFEISIGETYYLGQVDNTTNIAPIVFYYDGTLLYSIYKYTRSGCYYTNICSMNNITVTQENFGEITEYKTQTIYATGCSTLYPTSVGFGFNFTLPESNNNSSNSIQIFKYYLLFIILVLTLFF